MKVAMAIVFSNLQHKFRLQPGDVLSVNNRRCVHARTALKLNGGQRFLQVSIHN